MTDASQKIVVELQPIGRRAEVLAGQTLLEAAQAAGVELQAVCGGSGTCGHCRVRLVSGTLSDPTPQEVEELGEELLRAGYRMACQAKPSSSAKVDLPPESLTSAQRVQIESQEIDVPPDLVLTVLNLQVNAPAFFELRSELAEVAGQGVALSAQEYEDILALARQEQGQVRLVLRKDGWPSTIAGILAPQSQLLGLALDLGTTKIAGYLEDLETGKTVARSGVMNPQIAYGEDVISRIFYAGQNEECAKRLQRKVIDSLNWLALELCEEVHASPDQIVQMVVVGNTAMHHLFAGLPVKQLGMAPYQPAVTEAQHLSARELGLHIADGAEIYTPRNIAGYVGGDHVAMLLGVGMDKKPGNRLAIDIGTNTELTLSVNGRFLTCSCASGPAFEGAHILHGMRAAPGAIESVKFKHGEMFYYTIERQPAAGICGSGVLDVIASLIEAGVVDKRGNFRKRTARVRQGDSGSEFLLVEGNSAASGREIVLTRHDIGEIQFAKAAIRAGIDVLLELGGIKAPALDEFVIAGAFGSYLDVQSAIRLRLFPDIPLNRFQQVGNAAGRGARQMLISGKEREAADALAKRIEYIELTSQPQFHDMFMKSLFF